ncbi:MAG TPA: hypothetical protein VI386_02570 [Candidatus Sulfotelmatobacter sp.]
MELIEHRTMPAARGTSAAFLLIVLWELPGFGKAERGAPDLERVIGFGFVEICEGKGNIYFC